MSRICPKILLPVEERGEEVILRRHAKVLEGNRILDDEVAAALEKLPTHHEIAPQCGKDDLLLRRRRGSGDGLGVSDCDGGHLTAWALSVPR
jgi:hypothetical protein